MRRISWSTPSRLRVSEVNRTIKGKPGIVKPSLFSIVLDSVPVVVVSEFSVVVVVSEEVSVSVVVVPESEVRSGPAETFPVLFKVHDGLTVRLAGDREDWVRVSLGGDWQGWLPRGDVVRVRADGADQDR